MNRQNKEADSAAEVNRSEKHIKSTNKSILKLTYLEYLKDIYAKEFLKSLQQPHGLTELKNHETNFVLAMTAENPPSPTKKRNVFSELFKFGKQEPIDKEHEEVDGFIWVEDPEETENLKKNSLRNRLRKYFFKNPEMYKEKPRLEGEDYMVDDFVLIEPEHELQMENKFKEGLIDFAAGSLAGIIQVYVSQPLDTVKVKQQTFPKLYGNMFKCFLHTYHSDGIIHGLYAGTLPAVVASFAENSVLFTAYGACQKSVAFLMEIEKVSELSVLSNACAGSLAAFFSSFTLCPTELVKCRLQAVHEMKHYISKHSIAVPISSFKLTKDIFVTEGIPGFYRGLYPTIVREMPGFFFFFGGYEATREYYTESHQTKDDIGPLKTMCAGAVGGVALWTSTFPADVIKSRIQINNLKGSMLSVGADILQKEGFLAFYNGLLPTILRTIPATATLFLVYEYSKKILANKLL